MSSPPFEPQEVPIVRVHGHQAVDRLYVEFGQEGAPPQRLGCPGHVLDGRILERAQSTVDAVVDAGPFREGEVSNEPSFSGGVAFRDHAQPVGLHANDGSPHEGAKNAVASPFPFYILVDHLRVLRCGRHVPFGRTEWGCIVEPDTEADPEALDHISREFSIGMVVETRAPHTQARK